MPAKRRAEFRVPNMPRSRISECTPFWIYEHSQCQFFKSTSLQRTYVTPCRQQARSACSGRIALDGVSRPYLSRPYLRYGDRGRLQNVSPLSVLFESSQIFLQYTGDTDAKNDGPEFWNSNPMILENFLKFSKRHRAVPLRPIWTIMVAAKLDHSRVLVTKFHQNRSTLKGRSAGQRHTHRQTNSAENNGPSGLQ